ncbi:alkaline exonuclease [Clanis bilineata nucleopolyhedrovirus]|uniref:Alkaline exonuclease n=1 Tax=Clanis bilineata nucleopolyhedrovirus TaxID=1307957 RepID=Q0N3Y5_9ABAC|nr:alkaline exonuclease [Clanis bilineata nucleopolyhedrovirus]ABF47458.1 alkaline exonuclease [Clanis bilineata nucleopolyhedrovirus]
MSNAKLEEQSICDRFLYSNFVSSLDCVNKRLSKEDILLVEKMTRGQAANKLWNILRLDRKTASGSVNNVSIPTTAAMSFGIVNEKVVKSDESFISLVRKKCVEDVLGVKVRDTVLECGLFFTPRGLHSASPDAYFVTDDNQWIPVEIKCPATYKDTTIEQMRTGLGTRKQRYRVKNTALSVNISGPPLFQVEQKDAHYRQMQRQMYVLNAPLCVYIVKFQDSCVALTVLRNKQFCLQEEQSEQKLLEMYVLKNKTNKNLNNINSRIKSFVDQHHNFTDYQINSLSETGLYYNYGSLSCVFCSSRFDLDIDYNCLLDKHAMQCDRGNLKFAVMEYADHSKRVESLRLLNVDLQLAAQGLFYDKHMLKFRTFCCSQTTDFTNSNDNRSIIVKHTKDCKYKIIIDRQL